MLNLSPDRETRCVVFLAYKRRDQCLSLFLLVSEINICPCFCLSLHKVGRMVQCPKASILGQVYLYS